MPANQTRPPILKTLEMSPGLLPESYLIGQTRVEGINHSQLREFMLWVRELVETVNTLTQHVAMLERQLEGRGLIRLANDRHGDA